jgi:hypothetical protein
MTSYVVIEYSGQTVTRRTENHRTYTALKRYGTIALKNRLDKVEIIESDDCNVFTSTRHRGDTKWRTVRSEPQDQG